MGEIVVQICPFNPFLANSLSVSGTKQAPCRGFRTSAVKPRPEGRGFMAILINCPYVNMHNPLGLTRCV